MSKFSNDHLITREDHPCSYRGRLKSSVVRDPNGSVSTFRRFYQSGGRDYEQYRRWLQTLPQSEQQTSSSNSSNNTLPKISEMVSTVPSMLSGTVSTPPLKTHTQQYVQIPRITRVYPLIRPVRRHLPIRRHPEISLQLPAFLSSVSATSSLKSESIIPHECLQVATESCSPSGSFTDWSVTEVGQFIEKHFPEKQIARKFIQQKIDGRTLPLLTEDHLTRVFKMKLGPALYLLTLISHMQINN